MSFRTLPFVFLYGDQEPRSWGGRSNAPPPPPPPAGGGKSRGPAGRGLSISYQSRRDGFTDFSIVWPTIDASFNDQSNLRSEDGGWPLSLTLQALHILIISGSGIGKGTGNREQEPGIGNRNWESGTGTGNREQETGPGIGNRKLDLESGPGNGTVNRDRESTI